MSSFENQVENFSEAKKALLAKLLLEKRKTEKLRASLPIKAVSDGRKIFPLSFSQERIWFLDRLFPGNIIYNIAGVARIKGELKPQCLIESFNKVIQRHEILRARFKEVDGVPALQISEVKYVNPEIIDVSNLDGDASREKVQGIIEKEVKKHFNISEDLLVRFKLIRVSACEWMVLVVLHHIVADGLSTTILFKETASYYDALSKGNDLKLEPLPIQYTDYTIWQREQNSDKSLLNYWKSKLHGSDFELEILKNSTRTPSGNYEGARKQINIGLELTEKLKELAAKEGVTLFNVLLCALYILLYKYSGQEDLVVGTIVSGRNRLETKELIGCFINTLVLRGQLDSDPDFVQLLKKVNTNVLEGFQNQELPFERLVQEYYKDRNQERSPLCQIVFSFEEHPLNNLKVDGLEISFEEIDTGCSRIELELELNQTKEGLEGWFNYRTDLFEEAFISRLIYLYTNILEKIISEPQIHISSIEMMEEEERNMILYEFNNTKNLYSREKTIHQVFEEKVLRDPDKVALVFEGKALTYGELNEKSNQLARKLRETGIGPDNIVAVIAERSMEMIIGIFGILKAGGAYLPLDPAFPEERVRFMMKDSGASVLLKFGEGIEISGDSLIKVIDLKDRELYCGDCSNLAHINTSKDLAYIIYTSGSTGKPKAVMIEHRGIIRIVENTNYIEINKDDRILQLSNYAFDGSKFDIYGALLNGATLVLIKKEDAIDMEKLTGILEKENISVFFVTTALFNVIIDTNPESLKKVRKILFGGERASKEHIRKGLQYLQPRQIVNMYGPTESTVYATYYPIEKLEKEVSTVPIGRPISNTEIYIVDKKDKLLPVGIIGELCIGGDGLARGYLNRPDLTDEKFVKNPFVEGQKMYRTGDLAKWLPDGNIEFVGRIDHQVKIRGFRIELGEIENQIVMYDNVKEAFVAAKEMVNGQKYLCAYFVANGDVNAASLKEYLLKFFPDYMVPSHFIRLESLPLNSNGKVDSRSLPEPDRNISTEAQYEAPRNELEEKLVEIWKEVLEIDTVGIRDNFFELGGHSLKATALASKIHKKLNKYVSLGEIFKSPTVEKIAAYIENACIDPYSRIIHSEEKPYYPVSSAQKRMYISYQLDKNSLAYNMPFMVVLEGKIDREKLEGSLKKLIQRHETLRTSFAQVNGEPVQIIHKDFDFNIDYINGSNKKPEEIMNDFVKAFDLGKAPLLNVGLAELEKDRYLLLADMHHIISDGVSLSLFLEELSQLYSGKELDELKLQYRDFSNWQKEFLKTDKLLAQEKYWVDKFKGEIPQLNMPLDYKRPLVKSYEGDVIFFEIQEDLKKQIDGLARDTGGTLYIVLLAAFNILLSKYSGQEDIIVGSPVAGRPHPDLEKIIGVFINTLAMRNFPRSDLSVRKFIENVRDNSIEAFENQDFQFEKLFDTLSIQRNSNRNPLFDTMFIMQNAGDWNLEFEDIKFKLCENNYKTAKFDIKLEAFEKKQGIEFIMDYCIKLFKRESMESFAQNYIKVLEEIAKNPEIKIGDLDVSKHKEELISGFGDDLEGEF